MMGWYVRTRRVIPSGALGTGLLAVVLLLFPLLFQSHYYLGIMIVIGIYTIVTLGLCMLMGYAGQISLGQAGFYGLGAYLSAILTVRYGLPSWPALFLAAAVTALIAFVVGIPTFRLREHYLALATLGLGLILYIGFNEAIGLTGGPSGMTGLPYLSIGGLVFSKDREYFYLVWGFTLVGITLARNLVNSRVGRALRAIHGSEVAAESLGVESSRYKLQVFVLSAVYSSVAGSLYAHYVTFVNPSPFGFMASIQFLVMAVVGGLASVWGPLLGVGAIVILTELLREWVPRLLPKAGGEYEIIAFGVILMAVMIFMPEGLTGALAQLCQRAKALGQNRDSSRFLEHTGD